MEIIKNKESSVKKETYRLFREFLRLSSKYEDFCDMVRQAMKDVSSDGKFDSVVFDKVEELYRIKCESLNKPYWGTNLDEPWALQKIWFNMGDVHRTTFNDWWIKNESSLRDREIIDLQAPDAAENLIFFDIAIRRYRRNNRQENAKLKFPEPSEMLELLTADEEYFYVAIPLFNVTIKQIGPQLNKIREKWQAEWFKSHRDKKRKGMGIALVGDKYNKELDRYLSAYICINKLGWSSKKTIGVVYDASNIDVHIADKSKALSSDLKRAENIIRNTEKGIFPGPYQPEKRSKKPRKA